MMMKTKSILLIITLIIYSANIIAQNTDEYLIGGKNIPKDRLIINLISNTWLNAPDDLKIKPISLSLDVYSMSPIIGKKSQVSLAMGTGIGTVNYYINSIPGLDTNNNTIFINIPDSINYKRNKVTASYLDTPIELRFRTNPNSSGRAFKIAAGFRFGIQLSNHWKYKGTSLDGSDKNIKFKQYNIDNALKYRYGVYFRIGYGKFTVMGAYSLSNFFEKNKGIELTPVSLGLSFLVI